jgi:hypothetical protein
MPDRDQEGGAPRRPPGFRPNAGPSRPVDPELARARARIAQRARRQADRNVRVAWTRRGRPPSVLDELLDDLPGWVPLLVIVAGVIVWALASR